MPIDTFLSVIVKRSKLFLFRLFEKAAEAFCGVIYHTMSERAQRVYGGLTGKSGGEDQCLTLLLYKPVIGRPEAVRLSLSSQKQSVFECMKLVHYIKPFH